MKLEMELDELEAKTLVRCDKHCKARHVYKSSEAKEFWKETGHEEWSYVGNAKCTQCGRTAGRTACLVDMQREGEDGVSEREMSVEEYIK